MILVFPVAGGACGLHRGLDHGKSAAGVDGQQAGAVCGCGLHRALHGAGYIVQLEIQKNHFF
jgi:outer membrane lipoprotein SlyB